MENSNYPQTYPGSQYFPPPTAWVNPNSVSSDDNNTPAWVIASIVIVIVILCCFLFYYIRRREKKIRKRAASASASAAKSVTPPPAAVPKKEETPKKDQLPPPKGLAPAKPPSMGIPISYPVDCPSCGHRGGHYSFSYTCPLCKYKMEYNVVYPGKK